MPCKAELLAVDPALVPQVWPHARALVKRAIDRTALCDFADIEREVLAGLQQLWLGWNGTAIQVAAVTQLVTIAGRKICILVACGGHDRKNWLPLIAGLEQFARNEGCRTMRIIGRKGWSRVLDDYPSKYVVMEKELR
ncbi:hypothetical protein AOQ73_05895 [Bradyrhizobium pachyrhizi]|uniref:hypothetical protein n=1 Tax=Bradyrhizobium pachyrhizi TaxID=280333 RepID=UPI0007054B43|nr:hypothetical protein [Bradyrhizobium pachyrhizi]KRQ11938.1 hypothetical protein AOQ73_05895 [Bradyrhizobium pachyrhizi]